MLDDDKLSGVLSKKENTISCVSNLIHEANHMGGENNITVIVIDIIEGGHA